MATAPRNYDKIIFRFFMLANISGIITKYNRFINFRLIVTKCDQGAASPLPPIGYATATTTQHPIVQYCHPSTQTCSTATLHPITTITNPIIHYHHPAPNCTISSPSTQTYTTAAQHQSFITATQQQIVHYTPPSTQPPPSTQSHTTTTPAPRMLASQNYSDTIVLTHRFDTHLDV